MPHHLRIVHGRPDAAELAALTAVLTALACRGADVVSPGGEPGSRRADWDRLWRAHLPSGSWRARSGAGLHHR